MSSRLRQHDGPVLSLDNNVSGEFVGLGLKKKSAEKEDQEGLAGEVHKQTKGRQLRRPQLFNGLASRAR